MQVVFFGSDDFAAVNLRQVLASQHKVVGCVTKPDTRQGRGMKMMVAPIKQMAVEQGIPCLQPATLKDAAVVKALKALDADIFAVAAYGRLLTQEVLNIPRIFCVNVHGSLLPKYRGAAPIHWAILDGNTETGVTIQKMALALDAGDSIAQERMAIGAGETSVQLRQRMAEAGAKLLARTLDHIAAGDYQLTPQDEARATYALKLTKEMGKINWNKGAQQIYNQIRGLQPWPGATTFCNGKALKITQAVVTDCAARKPGQVISIDKQGFTVATADKGLFIREVHPQAGKVMPAHSFVAGYKISEGCSLGE